MRVAGFFSGCGRESVGLPVAAFLFLHLSALPSAAQITIPAPPTLPPVAPAPGTADPVSTNAPPAQAAAPAATRSGPPSELDRLTQSNQELLDLLKKQQAVLQDIQYDRRLQNRQIQSLEERLTDSIQQNAELQSKIARLEGEAAAMKAVAAAAPPPGTATTAAATPTAPVPLVPDKPPPPSTYLPPPDSGGAPDTKWWHRLFTLSGDEARTSDLFHIEGRQWRIVWHNQDREGNAYQNTSALFINAFPKDDTIPQKVCSKLGSGGDTTELMGPGNFYVKVEASGGKWELAVEDFR